MARNAPGKHYREGLSLVEIVRMFPDDAEAEAWFVRTRWPDGVRCPRCGSGNVQERPTRKPQPYRCRDCRKDFSVKTGTLMHSSPLGLQTWAIAVFLSVTSLKGVSSMKLHRDLGIAQSNAWHLAHRIREAWGDRQDPFAGPAEADETYFGGKRKNMPNRKRKELKGRGTVGKAAVAGVRDRATGHVAARRVSQTDASALHGFVREHVAPGSTLYTDEARAYRGMPEYSHEAVRHSAKEFVRGMASTNGLESFWSTLKRSYEGTYHKFSEKHLDRYVGEAVGRHNARSRDTLDMMAHLAAGMSGKRLRRRDLVADCGLPSGARPTAEAAARGG